MLIGCSYAGLSSQLPPSERSLPRRCLGFFHTPSAHPPASPPAPDARLRFLATEFSPGSGRGDSLARDAGRQDLHSSAALNARRREKEAEKPREGGDGRCGNPRLKGRSRRPTRELRAGCSPACCRCHERPPLPSHARLGRRRGEGPLPHRQGGNPCGLRGRGLGGRRRRPGEARRARAAAGHRLEERLPDEPAPLGGRVLPGAHPQSPAAHSALG